MYSLITHIEKEYSMATALEQLKQFSTLVADTADLELLKQQSAQDATTNPSLIYAASQTPAYADIILQGQQKIAAGSPLKSVVQQILAYAGQQILQHVPGRVSAEVDARLSFDTQATITYAYELVEEFAKLNIDKAQILIKVAATWQGLNAAKYLESQGIHCNITLIFHAVQAYVASQNKATLISPFVGRILDFYKAADPKADYSGAKDPGVISVTNIYHQLKKRGSTTQVMAASFRSIDEILQLAGCDLLTISPALLTELAQTNQKVDRQLDALTIDTPVQFAEISEAQFLWQMNNDPMASSKLADGIRKFGQDQEAFEALLQSS